MEETENLEGGLSESVAKSPCYSKPVDMRMKAWRYTAAIDHWHKLCAKYNTEAASKRNWEEICAQPIRTHGIRQD